MSTAGFALLLTAQWGAWGLHLGDPQATSGVSPGSESSASEPWRDELRALARTLRTACDAGDGGGCADALLKLQSHTREQLREEAAKLQISELQAPSVKSTNGDGFHAPMPQCAHEGRQPGSGGESRVVPEFGYRHVYKVAGYQIIMNLAKLSQGRPRLTYNFPGNYYKAFNELPSTFTFTFARNPLARFISGYTEMEAQGWSRPSQSEGGTTNRTLDFIRGLLQHGFYNGHMSPQVYFHLAHYQMGGRPFDFMGRLEDFEEGLRQIENRSNCSGRFGQWAYGIGGHYSSMQTGPRKAMNDALGKDIIPDWESASARAKDTSPSAWYSLGVDPHTGFEDAISVYANGTDTSMAAWAGLAMRDLLLSPGGAALRVVCLLLLPDYYALSYPLPSGCEHLSV